MKKNIFIFGFGYVAEYFSRLLINEGFTIFGTSRDKNTRESAKQNNIILCDFACDQVMPYLKKSQFILSCIPPNENGIDPVLDLFGQDISSNNNITWLGYLSTTSIYGDHQGQWVDENSESIDPTPSAQRRIIAESGWLSLFSQKNIPVHIFRLAGIYGPNRNGLTKLLAGKNQSIYKPNQFFSRIHVADISRILLASINQPTPEEIYNVCDDYPAPTHEVDEYAANLLNMAKPKLIPFEKAALSPMGAVFYYSNKKVSNTKIKEALAIKLLYPSFKEGLVNIKDNL